MKYSTAKIYEVKAPYSGQSKFVFWNDIQVGDHLLVLVLLTNPGRNNGLYATSVYVENVRTGQYLLKSITEMEKYLQKIDLVPVVNKDIVCLVCAGQDRFVAKNKEIIDYMKPFKNFVILQISDYGSDRMRWTAEAKMEISKSVTFIKIKGDFGSGIIFDYWKYCAEIINHPKIIEENF